MTAQDIFAAAIKLSADLRAAFVQAACGTDEALRQGVDALLRAHDESGALLPRHIDPAVDVTQPSPAQAQSRTVIAGRYKLLEAIGEETQTL